MAADGIEAPMPTDGTLIWSFLGEALAHDGLGRWAATSRHPRGGGVSQGAAQPMAVAPKCFPDAPGFWPLPLPSITNRKGGAVREPRAEEAGMRGAAAGPQ